MQIYNAVTQNEWFNLAHQCVSTNINIVTLKMLFLYHFVPTVLNKYTTIRSPLVVLSYQHLPDVFKNK